MYYIKGTIIRIDKTDIIIESINGIAYKGINIMEYGRGVEITVGELTQLYVLKHSNEFESNMLFFESEALRNLFKILLETKQVGIKTAQMIFEMFCVDEFIKIVENYDVGTLQKVKNIGVLTAKIIIDKINKILFNDSMSAKQEKIMLTLQRLGYRLSSIFPILKAMNKKMTEEQMLSESIRMLSTNDKQ